MEKFKDIKVKVIKGKAPSKKVVVYYQSKQCFSLWYNFEFRKVNNNQNKFQVIPIQIRKNIKIFFIFIKNTFNIGKKKNVENRCAKNN